MGITRIAPECKNLVWYEELTWAKVRDRVIKVNPNLARIIDEFKPSSKHTLILASYPFGTNIRDKGELFLPTEHGQLATLDETTISPDLREKLNYNSSPLALILDKSVEIYVETPEKRTVPFKLFRPGVTFGVWEIMQQSPISVQSGSNWSISAGARTLFMLPKIMDTANHRKLQAAYHMRAHVPRTIFEQTNIFKEIFNYTAATHPWATQILFFTSKWLETPPKNIGWHQLKEYWAQEAWGQALFWINKMLLDFNWEAYIGQLTRHRMKLKPYLLDTIKQLISIGCGVIPGFRPADESEQVAPTQSLQNAYINGYGLKTYVPTLMHPDLLLPNGPTKAVYYSLHAPTLPEKPSEFEEFSSMVKIIRELKDYMDVFLETMQFLPEISQRINFDFFHTETDERKGIQPTRIMPEFDPCLNLFAKKYGKRQFPANAPFFRGCVRISLQNSIK